ncbi:hypothetical protein ACLOJK_018463 [Asimina triloba]
MACPRYSTSRSLRSSLHLPLAESVSSLIACVYSGRLPVTAPPSITLGKFLIFSIPQSLFPDLHLPLLGPLSLPNPTVFPLLPSVPSQFSEACPGLPPSLTPSSRLSLILSNPPLSASFSSRISLFLPNVELDSADENTGQRLLLGTLSLKAVSNICIPEVSLSSYLLCKN